MAVRLEHDSEELGSKADPEDPLRSEDPVDGLFGLPVKRQAGRRAAPGPAPAPAGDADDPVASLFQAGHAVPAPAIPEAPSESELKRWNATVRSSSLFDESVVDPPPQSSASTGTRTRARPDPQAGVRTMQATVVGHDEPVETHEPDLLDAAPKHAPPAPAPAVPPAAPRRAAAAAPAPPPAASTAHAPAAPAPASPAPARKAKKDGATRRSGARNKRADAADGAEMLEGTEDARSAAAAPVEMQRKRVARGPNKLVLALVGLAALLSIGTAAAVIGLIPSPIALGFSGAPNATIAASPKPAPAPKPAAPKVTAAAPAAKPAATAVPAPATPVAAQASAAKPAPAPAVVAKAEKPAPAPAAAAAAQPAPPPAKAESAENPASADGESDANRLIAAANRKLAADDAKGAEALIREGLARDPDDKHLIEVLVRALLEQDRGQEAVPLARKIVKRRPKRVSYRLLLGDALLMTGDQGGARAEWQTAYEIDPQDHEVRMRLGIK
jgi:hypothetical protein